MQSIKPTANSVKCLGRTLLKNDILWLALSACGIEFSYEGKYLEICLQGDDHTAAPTDHARIAVYIDHNRILDEMIQSAQPRYTVIDSESPLSCTVRILKLSEAPMSVAGIRELIIDDDAKISPTPVKAHLVEFIGDSITCGYGTDDSDMSHTFNTSTEDVTKAYAYRVAQALDVDYSIVSYSGYGVYSGFTDENTDSRNTTELVPPYYPLVGFSRGTYNGTAITITDWDFHRFEPELIVLNLGTNDHSYCGSDADRQTSFASCYHDFLTMIHDKNPNAYILCVYGIMNHELSSYIEEAVTRYRQSSGSERISTLFLPTQTEADGYVVDFHPSLDTHRRSAAAVADKIREIMHW
ncbi:MAG: hypothetical protein K2L82_01760 [Lachnospiraceae bacterium]|nr:hypothetical protein [Lachnospiraceae bacterium]